MAKLFEPIAIGGLTLANRIVIAPMCQYSAEDGCMTDWHLIHLGQLALSGAGALTIEASAVTPEGRISTADVGLYNDATEAAMARVLAAVRRWSAIPVAISSRTRGARRAPALYDPRWPWHAAAALGATIAVPPQYERSEPRGHRGLFAR